MNSIADLPRILVVDLETTGINPSSHSIIQIGAVWLTGPRAGKEFSRACRVYESPGKVAGWDAGACRVHGVSLDRCFDYSLDPEGVAVREFVEWVGPEEGPVILAGLNVHFDLSFLLFAGHRERLDLRALFVHRVLDLHSLALARGISNLVVLPRPGGMRTSEIYAELGMPDEPRPHVAINGARHEAEAFRQLLGFETVETDAAEL